MIKKYQYLDKVNFPSDIKNLKPSELKILAKEVREEREQAKAAADTFHALSLDNTAKFNETGLIPYNFVGAITQAHLQSFSQGSTHRQPRPALLFLLRWNRSDWPAKV